MAECITPEVVEAFTAPIAVAVMVCALFWFMVKITDA